MGSLLKFVAAAFVAFAALGFSAASADGGRDRPERCDDDHDHRSHSATYYDYYDHDRYYRAGPYRGVSVTIGAGDRRGDWDRDRRWDDDYGYGDRYRDGDRYRGRDGRYDDRYDHRRSRVVYRQVFDTRYRARIVLVEQAFYSRRGEYRVCTVEARGPEARYVPRGQMRSIAARNCSRRSDIRILA